MTRPPSELVTHNPKRGTRQRGPGEIIRLLAIECRREPDLRTVIELVSRAAWLLPTRAPISLEYSQHRAKGHDVAMVIERRRVQARCITSVKEQGIGTIEPVTE